MTVELQKERIRRLGRDWQDRSTNSRGSHDQSISKRRETPIHRHPGRQDRLIKGRQGTKIKASRVRQDFTWRRAIHHTRIIKRNCIQAEKRLTKRPPHWMWSAQTFNWTDSKEKTAKVRGLDNNIPGDEINFTTLEEGEDQPVKSHHPIGHWDQRRHIPITRKS